MPRRAYEAQATTAGAFFLGGPQEIIDKTMAQYELFHHDRIMIQMGFGNVATEGHAACDRDPRHRSSPRCA